MIIDREFPGARDRFDKLPITGAVVAKASEKKIIKEEKEKL